jgi:hypothetical protein
MHGCVRVRQQPTKPPPSPHPPPPVPLRTPHRNHRCRIHHNIHFSGAVLRVTDGLGPTVLRDSELSDNTATAVLRFEGRTWVLNTAVFFAGIQFLDVLFYTQFQGASQSAYKFAELQHQQQQVRCCVRAAVGGRAPQAGLLPVWRVACAPGVHALRPCVCARTQGVAPAPPESHAHTHTHTHTHMRAHTGAQGPGVL